MTGLADTVTIPEIGSSFKLTPKILISTMPKKKLGMEMAAKARMDEVLSTIPFLCLAE